MLSLHGRKPELAALVKEYARKGWNVAKTRNNHLKFTAPTGAICFVASTPSCPRAFGNARADLRRIERTAHNKEKIYAGNKGQVDSSARAAGRA